MAIKAQLGDIYRQAQQEIRTFRIVLTNYRAQLASGPTSANVIKEILETCARLKTRFTALAATVGIGPYAKAQEDNPLYDIVAETTAVNNALTALITEITTAVPTGTGGFVLVETWGATGVSVRTFTAPQTAAIRTKIDDVLAVID